MADKRFAERTHDVDPAPTGYRSEAPHGTPGKATLVDAVQFDRGTAQHDDDHARQHATRGFSGSGSRASALPHFAQIQRAFGEHAIGDVDVFIGGAAEQACGELGAGAFASGGRVAFAQAPDLHTAAHELAHIVQQRGGGVAHGMVGRRGDAHEQHADAVADRVVRGESAAPLLDRYASTASRGRSGAAVQRYLGGGEGASTSAAPSGGSRASGSGGASGAGGRRARRDGAGSRGAIDTRMRATPRTPEELQLLCDRVVAAIAANEVHGASSAGESGMSVSADRHASYASATQATPVHAIPVLRGIGVSDPALAQERRDYATAHGLSQQDLQLASDVQNAAGRVWDAIVGEACDVSVLQSGDRAHDREMSGLTDDDVATLARMRDFRVMLNGLIPRYRALQTSVRALLTTRFATAHAWVANELAQLAHPAAGAETTTAPPTEDVAPAADAAAPAAGVSAADLLELLGRSGIGHGRDLLVAFANTPAHPGAWERWSTPQKRAWLQHLEHQLATAETARRTVALTRYQISHEASARREAQLLHFGPNACLGYVFFVHGIDVGADEVNFDHFNEDRAGWCRTALTRVQEQHPATPGAAPRTLDQAVGSAATDDRGYALSRVEFGTFVRDYLEQHPLASDETVVAAAADANAGHRSPDYEHTILGYWRTARAAETPTTTAAAAQ